MKEEWTDEEPKMGKHTDTGWIDAWTDGCTRDKPGGKTGPQLGLSHHMPQGWNREQNSTSQLVFQERSPLLACRLHLSHQVRNALAPPTVLVSLPCCELTSPLLRNPLSGPGQVAQLI